MDDKQMQRQEEGKNDFGVESNVAYPLGARLFIAGSNLKKHRPGGWVYPCMQKQRERGCLQVKAAATYSACDERAVETHQRAHTN